MTGFLKRSLSPALLIASVIFLVLGAAQPPVARQVAGNGEFEVAVWSNGTWQVARALPFDQNISQQQLDLSSFALTNPAQVRVAYKGANAAHIDTVTLGGQTPSSVLGASESPTLVAKKLARLDYDVIDAAGKTLAFTFAMNGQSPVLSLAARIEPEQNPGVPFEFPTSNIYGEVGGTSQFYQYRLNSVPGALKLNGDLNEENLDDPFFKEWSQPITGHPANFTYGWVRNDSSNLYVAIDFASDNTYDGDKDYTAVYVITASGVMKFKVSVPEQQWGIPAFEYTDKAVYQHKVYEFKIPLAQIGVSADRDSAVELAFEAYGTSATASLISSLNPSTYGQCVTFTVPTQSRPTSLAPGINVQVGFYDGNTLMGQGNYNPGNGTYAFTTCSLSVGRHAITARQNNDRVIAGPLDQLVLGPAEVPEADTLLLLGGGLGGLATWVGWQWRKRRAKNK